MSGTICVKCEVVTEAAHAAAMISISVSWSGMTSHYSIPEDHLHHRLRAVIHATWRDEQAALLFSVKFTDSL